MKTQWILLAVCASAFCGCGKKDAASSANAPPLTAEQTAQIEAQYVLPNQEPAAANPATPQPQTGQRLQPAQPPIQQRLNGAIHAQLTIQLRRFIEKNGRMPDTFTEFANSAMDSVPLAPDGMKYVIDPADRTVKAVKK